MIYDFAATVQVTASTATEAHEVLLAALDAYGIEVIDVAQPTEGADTDKWEAVNVIKIGGEWHVLAQPTEE